MKVKHKMVRTASLRVRGKANATLLANELTNDDFTEAFNARRNGTRLNRNHRGEQILGAVDAIASSVPHTNEAAKRARQDGEALQHYYGMASYFLTVTPDDQNSFVIRVLTGSEIHSGDDIDVADISDEQLSELAKKRDEIRITFPGMCAFYFEIVLDIITKYVIGYDLKTKCPMEQTGIFGKCEALALSVEEQGRGTLHSHMQIWVPEFNIWRDHELQSSIRDVGREAKTKIIEKVDQIVSTALLREGTCISEDGANKDVFKHECENTQACRYHRDLLPKVVDNQDLRYLRNRHGYNMNDQGTLAYCRRCKVHTWSSEKLVESFLIQGKNIPGLTKFPDNNAKRLKTMAM